MSSALTAVDYSSDPLPVPSEQGSEPGFRRSSGLPPSVTEADFLAATESVTERLTSRFAALFGGPDDFAQEVVLWSLEAVRSFDPARGALGGLLYRTARNRCLNRIRDTVTRADAPCAACHAGTPCGPDGEHCARYAAWYARNQRKANLHKPLSASVHPGLVETQFSPSHSAEDTATATDLSLLIDQHLPIELRADYLKMRDSDVPVSLQRRQRIQRAVAQILADAGVDPPECEPGKSRSAAQLPVEDEDEQEDGGDERPLSLGTESVPSTIIPESFDVALSGLSSSAA